MKRDKFRTRRGRQVNAAADGFFRESRAVGGDQDSSIHEVLLKLCMQFRACSRLAHLIQVNSVRAIEPRPRYRRYALRRCRFEPFDKWDHETGARRQDVQSSAAGWSNPAPRFAAASAPRVSAARRRTKRIVRPPDQRQFGLFPCEGRQGATRKYGPPGASRRSTRSPRGALTPPPLCTSSSHRAYAGGLRIDVAGHHVGSMP